MIPVSMSRIFASLAIAGVCALAAAPASAQTLDATYIPKRLSEHEPTATPLQPPGLPSHEEGAGSAFMECSRIQLEPHVGFMVFSSDYKSDPHFGGGLLVRAPLPWLSRDVLGMERDGFGAFFDLSLSSISRKIVVPGSTTGTLLFATLGLDFAFISDESFSAQVQLGIQYGYFGGAADAQNGVAPLLGLAANLPLTDSIAFTFNPQIGFGHSGDFIYFFNFGALISF